MWVQTDRRPDLDGRGARAVEGARHARRLAGGGLVRARQTPSVERPDSRQRSSTASRSSEDWRWQWLSVQSGSASMALDPFGIGLATRRLRRRPLESLGLRCCRVGLFRTDGAGPEPPPRIRLMLLRPYVAGTGVLPFRRAARPGSRPSASTPPVAGIAGSSGIALEPEAPPDLRRRIAAARAR